MPISGETLMVVAIVSVALLFTGRRVWRAIRSARGMAGGRSMHAGCDCEAAPSAKKSDWAG